MQCEKATVSHMTTIYETQQDRTDLPLVVMPCVMKGMIEPFKKWFGLLDGIARVRMYEDFTFDENEFIRRCDGASAVMVVGFHISDHVLSILAEHVRCLAFSGTGVASFIDVDKAKQLGVRVCNVVHYGDHAVAEFAIALMLEVLRGIGRLNTEMHAGKWDSEAGMGSELYGKKLGIVGLGGIGRTVAQIAQAYGMHVSAWKSPVSHKDYNALGITPVEDLAELMGTSDIVSLHLPLLDSTRGIITARELNAMRPGTVFINTARAELIQSRALLARLQKGDIRAGLDVYDQEPLPADSPLLKVPGLILTPHVAWHTLDAYRNLTKQVVQDIQSFYTGGSMNVVA